MIVFLVALAAAAAVGTQPTPPDVNTIIQRSLAANERDWNAAPNFNYFEIDRTGEATRTFKVTTILGSPYSQLVAINGKPLSSLHQQEEQQRLNQVKARRAAESRGERAERIAKYQRDRKRDHLMLQQMTKAFNFKLQGEQQLDGYSVYVLQATPRPDYRPPTFETQALKGMEGTLWIEKNTFQWVKVEAKVVTPVTIEGFLARVEPGTRFDLENAPVNPQIWMTKHFSMRSRSRILFLFPRSMQQDQTFYGYQQTGNQNGHM